MKFDKIRKAPALLALGAIATLGLVACEQPGTDTGVGTGTDTQTDTGFGTDTGVGTDTTGQQQAQQDVDDITDDPQQYEGQTVTVTGDVQEVFLDQNAFFMEGDGMFTGDEVLVVNAGDLQISDNENVRVTGTVQQMTAEQLQQQYGLTLEGDRQQQFQDGPQAVIVADMAERTDTQGGV